MYPLQLVLLIEFAIGIRFNIRLQNGYVIQHIVRTISYEKIYSNCSPLLELKKDECCEKKMKWTGLYQALCPLTSRS